MDCCRFNLFVDDCETLESLVVLVTDSPRARKCASFVCWMVSKSTDHKFGDSNSKTGVWMLSVATIGSKDKRQEVRPSQGPESLHFFRGEVSCSRPRGRVERRGWMRVSGCLVRVSAMVLLLAGYF